MKEQCIIPADHTRFKPGRVALAILESPSEEVTWKSGRVTAAKRLDCGWIGWRAPARCSQEEPTTTTSLTLIRCDAGCGCRCAGVVHFLAGSRDCKVAGRSGMARGTHREVQRSSGPLQRLPWRQRQQCAALLPEVPLQTRCPALPALQSRSMPNKRGRVATGTLCQTMVLRWV
jgi:hypothetical protein